MSCLASSAEPTHDDRMSTIEPMPAIPATAPTTGGRGLKPFRLLPSASGTDDFTFEAPAPATYAGMVMEQPATRLREAAPALLLLLDCAEGASPVKRTIVLVRMGRVWHPKPGFRLTLLGSYTDPRTGEPGAIYEAVVDLTANAQSLS